MSLQTGQAWVPQANESPRSLQLPRSAVAPVLIAPGSKRPQGRLPPWGRPYVSDGRKSASEHGREIANPLPQVLGQPRRIGVAPVREPVRLGPLLGRAGKDERRTPRVAKAAHYALHVRVADTGCRRQGRVYVEHDLRG